MTGGLHWPPLPGDGQTSGLPQTPPGNNPDPFIDPSDEEAVATQTGASPDGPGPRRPVTVEGAAACATGVLRRHPFASTGEPSQTLDSDRQVPPDAGGAGQVVGADPVEPRDRRVLFIGTAIIAVVAVVGAAAWAFTGFRTATATSNPTAATGTPPTGTAIQSPASIRSIPASSPESTGSVVTMTVTAAPPAAAPAPDPMGGPRVDIICQPGYIVQVASELSKDAFVQRVVEIRAQGVVPARVMWTETSGSCGIFSNTTNAFVLYAGPFASPYDACEARLAGPADSFIKGTTVDTAHAYVSCQCRADTKTLPVISTVGQQGVWVGELQRILANRLEYSVNDLDSPTGAKPSGWGTFTPDTASAVQRFQRDHSLPVTGEVNAATWSALQAAQC